MEINRKKIKTVEEYLNFVREFVTLLDEQLERVEKDIKNKENLHEIARQMPALISLINTVGYLRGQDGIFSDIKPKIFDQSELLNYEDLFESRLDKLIDILISSDEKQYYINRLESYLVKSRSKQKVTEW